jgi:hypothetical protein
MSRTPNNFGEISFSGITEGDVPGSWLLSYRVDSDLDLAVATFESREAALDMAAQIDDLTKIEREWTVETVFKNPQFADELIDMMGMEPGCHGCTGCDVDLDDFDEDDWDDEEDRRQSGPT